MQSDHHWSAANGRQWELSKTVYVTTVPVIDGLGRVSSSCKDGEGVSLCIRTCNGGLTGGTTYCGTVQGVYRTRPDDDSMLAEAGNGGWEQQQLQQRPSKPLPLLANASAGGGSGSYGGGSYPDQRPCPRRRVMGGSHQVRYIHRWTFSVQWTQRVGL